MYDTVTEIVGSGLGPVSIILGGVHGDERCGVEALDSLISSLDIGNGVVYLMYGNPRAIETGVRHTGTNLNRVFDDDYVSDSDRLSYEYARAQKIKSYLDKSSALLDLHASSVPGSKAFAICSPSAQGLVECLPVDLVITGFDDVEPGATDYYMNTNGKIGICLECGYLADPKSTDLALAAVYDFLVARGHIDGLVSKTTVDYVKMYKKYYAKTDNFRLEKQFANFEDLKKDQLIGMDGDVAVQADRDCVIVFAHNGNKIGDEVFLLGQKKNSLV